MSGGLRKPRLTKPQAGTTPNVLSVDAKPIVFAGIQIPTIRKKTALPQEKPTNKQPRPAKQPAAVSNVASGPFSMGPAAANKTGARNAFSSSLALPKDGVKTESERLGRTIMDPEYIAHEVVLETQPIPTKWTPIKLDSLNTPGPPGNILKDKLHFFQLPSTLPQTTGNNRGVLNVHKSGKITMVIDGVVFNVSWSFVIIGVSRNRVGQFAERC